MKSQETTASAVGYFLAGAAVGAIVSLLFAPKKGSELRGDIEDFGRQAGQRGQELYSQVMDYIPGRVKAGAIAGAAAGAVKGAGTQAYRGVKEKIDDALKS